MFRLNNQHPLRKLRAVWTIAVFIDKRTTPFECPNAIRYSILQNVFNLAAFAKKLPRRCNGHTHQ